MITTYPSIQRPSGQFVTTLEYSAGHCTVLFTLSLLYYDILTNRVLVRVTGIFIPIETMAAMNFKLILPFLLSTFLLLSDGMSTHNVQVG